MGGCVHTRGAFERCFTGRSSFLIRSSVVLQLRRAKELGVGIQYRSIPSSGEPKPTNLFKSTLKKKKLRPWKPYLGAM